MKNLVLKHNITLQAKAVVKQVLSIQINLGVAPPSVILSRTFGGILWKKPLEQGGSDWSMCRLKCLRSITRLTTWLLPAKNDNATLLVYSCYIYQKYIKCCWCQQLFICSWVRLPYLCANISDKRPI